MATKKAYKRPPDPSQTVVSHGSFRVVTDGKYARSDNCKPIGWCDVIGYQDQHTSYRISPRREGAGLIDSLNPLWYTVIPISLFKAWEEHVLTDEQFLVECLLMERDSRGVQPHHTAKLPPWSRGKRHRLCRMLR